MTELQPHTPSLKKHVHKLVDDWLGLGDLDDRPIESESDFEQWVEQKIKAGDELSSFAEEVLDELLGQFKGTKRDVGPDIDRIIAAAEQRGAAAELEALGDKLIDGKDPETDTRIFDPWDVAQMLYTRADVIKNPPRADRITAQEDDNE